MQIYEAFFIKFVRILHKKYTKMQSPTNALTIQQGAWHQGKKIFSGN